MTSAEDYKARVVAALGRYHAKVEAMPWDERVAAEKDAWAEEHPKARRTMAGGGLSEADEQRVVVQWLRAKGIRFFAVPNGAVLRGSALDRAKQMSWLKCQGLQVGAPDIVLVDPAPGCKAPVAVEMKSMVGKVSEAQEQFLDEMEARGWKVIVAHGAEQAILRLSELGY